MNEQGKMNLKQVMERTTLTLGDIASEMAALYEQDKSLLNGKILISFDATNGNLDCLVWKSDSEAYSLFSNDSNDKRQKDFQVIVKFPISNEDKKIVEKIVKDMKPNTIKRINIDKIREEIRNENNN